MLGDVVRKLWPVFIYVLLQWAPWSLHGYHKILGDGNHHRTSASQELSCAGGQASITRPKLQGMQPLWLQLKLQPWRKKYFAATSDKLLAVGDKLSGSTMVGC